MYVRANHSSTFPRNILVFDTETESSRKGKEEYHVMKIAWTLYAELDRNAKVSMERWKFWNKRFPFCEYVRDLASWKGKLYMVGVNIFFDLQVSGFFKYFTLWGWTLDFIYESGTTYILTIRKDNASITCVSMTNFLPASVKSLGTMVGLSKLEVDFDTADIDLLSIYCFRDTEITFTAFLQYLQFVHDRDLGKFSLTRASQSMAAFRHRFMKSKVYRHSDENIRELEERAYFGGRTESFFIGKAKGGPFLDLDVNSMYPFIMKSKPMPVKALDYLESPILTDLSDCLSQYAVIADVTLSTNRAAYPWREKTKVVFPVGRFSTVLCTEALKYALSHGDIKRIKSMAVYEIGFPFVEYIDYFYNLRLDAKKDGNDIYQRFAKLFMNSLYGKFAQRKPIEIEREEVDFDGYFRREIWDMVTHESVTETQLFNTRIVTKGSETMPTSVVAIPAHITDYGRMLLWSIIESSGSGVVLYCDTDSVKIRESDLSRIAYPLDDSELGSLKVEGKYRKLLIHGPKDYETESVVKMKGVPKKNVQLSHDVFQYQQWLRHNSHLRRGEYERYIIRDIVKELRRIYTKGHVQSDGTVLPWKFPRDLAEMRSLD